MKGYLKQKGIPTPDKPVPIETIYIYGKPFIKKDGKWYTNKAYLEYISRKQKKEFKEYFEESDKE